MENFRQLNSKEKVKGDYRRFAQINIKTSTLEKKFILKFEDYEELGLGVTTVGTFVTENGTQFYLQGFPTVKVCTHIGCLNNPKTIAVDLDEVFGVLELDS